MQELRRECAGLDAEGEPRPRKEVAWSLQRYLLFAVLSCVPGEPLSELLLLSIPQAQDPSSVLWHTLWKCGVKPLQSVWSQKSLSS